MSIDIIDQDNSQLTFSDGVLTDVEADAGGYLALDLAKWEDYFASDTTANYTWSGSGSHTYDAVNDWIEIRTENDIAEDATWVISGKQDGYAKIVFTKRADYTADNGQSLKFLQDANNYYSFGFCGSSYTNQFVKKIVGGTTTDSSSETGSVDTDGAEFTVEVWWTPTNIRMDIDGTTRFNLTTTDITALIPNNVNFHNYQIDCDWKSVLIKSHDGQGNRLSPQLDLSAVGTVDSSSISWTRQYIQDVLSFDGVDDVVNTTLTPPSPITFEAWIKADDFGERGFILRSGGAVYLKVELDGKLYFCVYTTGGNSNYLSSTIVLNTNQWYHVAATWDGTINADSQKLYIGGTLDNSNAASGTAYNDGTYRFTIGAQSTTWHHFDGEIVDARIWNDVRTQAEIQNNMDNRLNGNEANLVGYWPMDEGSGTTVFDNAGTNDGTIDGATWTTDDLSDIFDVLTIETRASLDSGTTWTTWTAATNGGSIPGLVAGDDVSNGLLECRQTLSISDPTVTPELDSLTLQINSSIVHEANLIVDSSVLEIEQTILSSNIYEIDNLIGVQQILFQILTNLQIDSLLDFILSGQWAKITQNINTWTKINKLD